MSIEYGVAVPGIVSALSFYDGLKTSSSNANLIQAQRDYFGAHTFELKDKPRGTFYHADWSSQKE